AGDPFASRYRNVLLAVLYSAKGRARIRNGEGWDAVDYNEAQDALKEKLRSWLKAGWLDAVRPKTVAFVRTLIALAKQDGERRLRLLVPDDDEAQRRVGDGRVDLGRFDACPVGTSASSSRAEQSAVQSRASRQHRLPGRLADHDF